MWLILDKSTPAFLKKSTSVPPSESNMYTTSTWSFLNALTTVLAAMSDFPDYESPHSVLMRPTGNPLWMSPVNTRFIAYEPESRNSVTLAKTDSSIV